MIAFEVGMCLAGQMGTRLVVAVEASSAYALEGSSLFAIEWVDSAGALDVVVAAGGGVVVAAEEEGAGSL